VKVGELIKKLSKLKEKHGNLDIVIDYDENGYYDTVSVKPIVDDEGDLLINIKSSNEC